MIKVLKTEIDGVLIVEPDVFSDNRGWFYETYSYYKYKEAGIDTVFVQDNRSFSAKKGTIRGIHFQTPPMTQAKLVSCTRGEILDVAVDLRKNSPTYKKWVSVKLSEENKTQIFIPKGFAHGFLSLTDNVELLYKVDEFYSPENDGGLRFDDPDINIDWGITDPILSEKDMKHPYLKDTDLDF